MANGCTELMEGSHKWSDEQITTSVSGIDEVQAASLTPVEMTVGSLIVFAGTLLHREGANRSSAPRRAFSHQYCELWARQQENFMLSIPRERVKSMSLRLRALLGYSIHPTFMGQLAGRHPEKILADDYVNSLVADDELIANVEHRF